MKNEEFIALLKKGVDYWNRWRVDNPDIEIMVSKISLRGEVQLFNKDILRDGIDFHGVSFINSDLYYARLYNANLQGAKFQFCQMEGIKLNHCNARNSSFESSSMRQAHLYASNFSRSRIIDVDFERADINNVDLSEADLEYTTFNETDLHAVDCSRAVFGRTVLCGINLENVSGLETAQHSSPSYLSIDTIIESRGNIPEIFLQGVGVPQIWVDYIPSLIKERPIEFHKCFVSYSRKDIEFADKLYYALKSKGIRVWMDRRDLETGSKFRKEIEDAIHIYDKVIAIVSENSIKSRFVEDEVEAVFEREEREGRDILMPIIIDDSIFNTSCAWAAVVRRKYTWCDFRNWENYQDFQSSIDKLLRDLEQKEKSES